MSNEPVAYINMERRSLEWAKPMRWETPTVANLEPVPLYIHPFPANDFHPDWDVVAPMLEEQQRMAKRIEELEAALRGDVEPVAWIGQNPRDGGIELCSFKPAPSVLLDFNMKPIYTHPASDVVKQLVEALDMMERHFSRYDDTHNCLVLDQAKAALAAAKEDGL